MVDFRPYRLEDFAFGWEASNEPSQATDSSLREDGDQVIPDSQPQTSGPDSMDFEYKSQIPEQSSSEEWEFFLLLKDATPARAETNTEIRRVWVYVGNEQARRLTGLDATDLQGDPEKLSQLRDQMFTIWGDLYEKRTADRVAAARVAAMRLNRPPPVDSSAAEDCNRVSESAPSPTLVRNRPFLCCVRRDENRERDQAGAGEVWERTPFVLFGTKISAPEGPTSSGWCWQFKISFTHRTLLCSCVVLDTIVSNWKFSSSRTDSQMGKNATRPGQRLVQPYFLFGVRSVCEDFLVNIVTTSPPDDSVDNGHVCLLSTDTYPGSLHLPPVEARHNYELSVSVCSSQWHFRKTAGTPRLDSPPSSQIKTMTNGLGNIT